MNRKEYCVANLDESMLSDFNKVEALSPIAAVKKVYPNLKIQRDWTNTGAIVVKGRAGTYVYKIIE